jgi:tetratricopeptide (TPR) repeat protein
MKTAHSKKQNSMVREITSLIAAGKELEAESSLLACSMRPPSDAATQCELAGLALELGKTHLARTLLGPAQKAAPHSSRVNFLLGVTERALGNLELSASLLRRAEPAQNPNAAYYLSLVLEASDDLEGAHEAISQALAIHPEDADYLNQCACVATRLGRHAEARDMALRAHQAEPEDPGFAFNYAQVLLQHGNFVEGWSLFDARLAFTPPHLFPENGSRLWQGEPLDGKSLLVWHEQGLGDTIQFSRFLPALSKTGARVIFRCQAELVRLLGKHLHGIEVINEKDDLPKTDFHLPLLSLPSRLGTHGIPASILPQNPPSHQRKTIACAWAGNPHHPSDAQRSIAFATFAPLFSSSFRWISFQKGFQGGLPHHVENLGNLSDFWEAAQILQTVDLVITVDTALAHLAGSLGMPTWILLPFAADWRWGLSSETSPWYPSVRLFRQQSPGDWNSVITSLHKKLMEQKVSECNMA